MEVSILLTVHIITNVINYRMMDIRPPDVIVFISLCGLRLFPSGVHSKCEESYDKI